MRILRVKINEDVMSLSLIKNVRNIGIIARFLRENKRYLDYVNDVESSNYNRGQTIAKKLDYAMRTHTTIPMYAFTDVVPRGTLMKWDEIQQKLKTHYDGIQIAEVVRACAKRLGVKETELWDKIQGAMDNDRFHE